MRFQFIEEHRDEFPIHRMCGVLQVSPSGYYGWWRREPSQREEANMELVAEIKTIHLDSRQTYGSPRVHGELLGRGFSASKNRVAPLMRAEDIRARRKKKRQKTINSNPSYPIAPNLLNRDFPGG